MINAQYFILFQACRGIQTLVDMYVQLFAMMSSDLSEKTISGDLMVECEVSEYDDRPSKTWHEKHQKVSH